MVYPDEKTAERGRIFVPGTVSIGHQNFETIRTNDYFYIDKTSFISRWWEKGDSVTLLTRPRRFGKTLAMSMVEQFFSVEYANRGELFEGLDIWKNEKYRRLQGTRPVIGLSFANVKESTYENTRLRLNQILTDLYGRYRFLLEGNLLSSPERQYFESVLPDMPEVDATLAIHRLCCFLSRCYGKKVIVLLDEYDTPMQEAYVNGYWKELTAFMRSLFNASFKTNPYLDRAILSGITRVSRESVFSDLNNLKVVTTTSDEYADCFGFTEQEVACALEEFGLGSSMSEVRKWYDGFCFGKLKDIYNPWSVINYLDTGKLAPYWANTSENGLADKLIREGSREIKSIFEELLRGGRVKMNLDEQIVYDRLDRDDRAVWSLLVAGGYLKITDCQEKQGYFGESVPEYEIMLTNLEVRLMFYDMVRQWFARPSSGYNDFIKALLRDDVEAMNDFMNQVIRITFSSFDTGGSHQEGDFPAKSEPERFYHGFVLGLLVELTGRYVVTSNRESGFGRYDVMLEPLRLEDPAIILEFKVFDPRREKDLRETAMRALRQIREKQYDAVLTAKGISKERIRNYGFAFEGRHVLIAGQ